ncbi:MAG: hypothetical protein OXG72_14330 [Acidobacteria bacterium]|nr:hypothetical protein [Acidobacteriota bacterium]
MTVFGLPRNYTPLDESRPEIAAVVKQARREAGKDHCAAPSQKLIGLVAACSPPVIDHMRVCVMIRLPVLSRMEPAAHFSRGRNRHYIREAHVRPIASGMGGIWAVASRLVNEAADAHMRA